jgi:hypothetical protein
LLSVNKKHILSLKKKKKKKHLLWTLNDIFKGSLK